MDRCSDAAAAADDDDASMLFYSSNFAIPSSSNEDGVGMTNQLTGG